MAQLGRRHPAVRAQLLEEGKCGLVVDVQRGPRHEGNAVFTRQLDGPHVIGLDAEFALFGNLAQAPQIGFALQQHL